MRKVVKQIIRTAGLRDELTFTSFRHGGITEGADTDLTDPGIRAQSRQKSSVLPRYAKRNHEAGRGRREEAARDTLPVFGPKFGLNEAAN